MTRRLPRAVRAPRALVAAIPVAMLGTACGLRPWTPSANVAYVADEVPAVRTMQVPTSRELAAAWQLPAGDPWARYGKSTLVSALDDLAPTADLPDARSLDEVADADLAAARIAAAGLPSDTALIVDLRGAASVAFGARLTHAARTPVSCVLTFNNWPDPNGIVPADETLAALVQIPPRPRASAAPPPAPDAPNAPGPRLASTPVFLLDAWRLAYRTDDPGDGTYDNRYMLMPGDLPTAEALHAELVTRVLYVVDDLDETETEEDDLHAIFLAYQAAGISIHMVDLSWLRARELAPRWPTELAGASYWVTPRRTLLDDPVFFARARGGFGGVHGRPFGLGSSFRPGTGGSGGGFRGGGGGG